MLISNDGNNFERIELSAVGLVEMIKVINKFKNKEIHIYYFSSIFTHLSISLIIIFLFLLNQTPLIITLFFTYFFSPFLFSSTIFLSFLSNRPWDILEEFKFKYLYIHASQQSYFFFFYFKKTLTKIMTDLKNKIWYLKTWLFSC